MAEAGVPPVVISDHSRQNKRVQIRTVSVLIDIDHIFYRTVAWALSVNIK